MFHRTRVFCCFLLANAACGAKAASPDDAGAASDVEAEVDAGSADAKADQTAASDGGSGDSGGTDSAAGGADAKDTKSGKDVNAPACATRAGAWDVDGTCGGGNSSITFACMLASGCNLTWVADYRTWSGPLTGVDYLLTNADSTETITGQFTSADTGTYTYASGPLSCDATMARHDATSANSLCCDVLANDCGGGEACVVVGESVNGELVATTGCLPLAKNATEEGAACTQSAAEAPCKPGAICIRTSAKGPEGVCRHQCTRSSDCQPGEQCEVTASAPRAGVCAAACAPFADEAGGAACGDGRACGPTVVADGTYQRAISAGCTPAGSVAVGGKCGAGLACAAGAVCDPKALTCTPLCDTKHPCAAGKCGGYGLPNAASLPPGFGYCK